MLTKVDVMPQPTEGQIGGKNALVINARDLHQYLNAGKRFADWIRARIDLYGFEEHVDFSSFHKIEKRETGATVLHEYQLSLDMAKELCMIQNNEKGRAARRYFIEAEKKMTIIERVVEQTGQLSLWDMEPASDIRMRDLLVDVALQAKAGSKLAQFLRLVKPLVMRGKGGAA